MVSVLYIARRNCISAIILVIITLFICGFFSEGYCFQPRETTYAVHIASYKNIAGVHTSTELLKRKGLKPFYRRANIPGKGVFYRIFADSCESRSAAINSGKKLKQLGIIKEFNVLEIKKPIDLQKKPPPVTKTVDSKHDTGKGGTSPGNLNSSRAQVKEVMAEQSDKSVQSMIKEPIDLQKEPPPVTKTVDSKHDTGKGGISSGDLNSSRAQVKEAMAERSDKSVQSMIKRPIDLQKKPSPAAKTVDSKHDTGNSGTSPGNQWSSYTNVKTESTKEEGITQFQAAVKDFEKGKYEDALGEFNDILNRDSLASDKKEIALRRVADCYFNIGKSEKKQNFQKAIDSYKSIISKYPTSEENALVHFRLAQSYANSKMNNEAISELKVLCKKYPEAAYIPDALHMMGTVYYRMKRYKEAVEEFRTYVKLYENGKYVKNAYFQIGDCYSQMKKFKNADYWYRKAMKRWPDLEDISQDNLLKQGSHYFRTGQYDKALEALIVYINLYPEGENSKWVLYSLARSFVGIGKDSFGLKMLSLVMEKYPESEEAKESAVIMANIGVRNPGIDVPNYIFCGMDNYQDPIGTYNRFDGKFDNPIKKRENSYRKGCGLLEMKKYRDAFDTFYALLGKTNIGKRKEESQRLLVLCGRYLVDRLYQQKDYINVADIYFKTRWNGLFEHGELPMLFKIGDSLYETGLLNQARKVYEEMVGMKITKGERGKILLAIAKVELDENRYEDAKKTAKELMKDQSTEDGIASIKATDLTGDIFYRQGKYEEAASYYSEVINSGIYSDGITEIYKKYADALKKGEFFPTALINYRKAVENCRMSDDTRLLRMKSYEGLGECFYHEGYYDKSVEMYKKFQTVSSNGEQDLWGLYWMGRSYLNHNDKAGADQIFSSVREKGKEEFWSTIINYCVDEKRWSDTCRRYVKN